MGMHVSPVDPRDQDWEDSQPRYRVYFHEPNGTSEEYEVSGANVVEVLDWADANRGDRSYVLYACILSNGLGLVRLAGQDPTETSPH